MLYPMKMSQNRWTAGNALSWALGVMLGLIVGVALLIAIPRMMFTPTVSGDSTQPPTAAAQTGDSSGAATTTEQPGATDETGMASGQTSGNAAQGTAAQGTGAEGTGAEGTEGAAAAGAGALAGAGEQSGSAAGSEGAEGAEGGSAEAGQQFFGGSCAGCHGAEGQGGVGPALNQAATWSDAEFTTALREGRTPEKELSPVMPRFTEAQLSAQQVADVHAYVKSLY